MGRVLLLQFILSLVVFISGCSPGTPVLETNRDGDQLSEPIAPATSSTTDWPWWRGPTLDGKAADGNVALTWSKSENIVWKQALPGRGHSSPCVWGDRIFLATADETEKTQSLLCFDRQTGRSLWSRELHRGKFSRKHGKNSHASGSPACDGSRIFISFLNDNGIWTTAVDFDGEVLWQKQAGAFKSQHGYAASPLLFESMVIVAGDNMGSGFLTALDRRNGKTVWKAQRPNQTSFSSPIVAHIAGRDQLVISGCHLVTSFNPRNGEVLWTCAGPATVAAGTVTFDHDHIFTSGGYPERHTLCIKADGSGDVTRTHIVWSNNDKTYVPSMLLHQGRLYTVTDQGIGICYDAADGNRLWKKRVGGSFSASPILAGEHIFVPDEKGTTYVFQAGPQYKLVAKNDLGDGGFASPVICGGRIYLRTNHSLFCIGK